jgi:hypothetical protein
VRHDRFVSKVSVHLDDAALRALRELESLGMTRSVAVRTALIATAKRVRSSKGLRAEASAIESDDDDRREMLAVSATMAALRSPRPS